MLESKGREDGGSKAAAAKSTARKDKGVADLLVSFAAGDVVYAQGDAGNEMYIVEEGQVELSRRFGPRQRRIAVLEIGDFFGEMSVLEGRARSESARAASECRLLPVDSSTFDQLLREYPELVIRIMRKLSRRLGEHEEANERAMAVAAAGLTGDSKQGISQPITPLSEIVPTAEDETQPMKEALPLAPAAFLRATRGRGEYPLATDRVNVVGRGDPAVGMHPEVDLCDLDTRRSLSRRHATVRFEDGRFLLREEVGAANGTLLNGKRLVSGEDRRLADGDELRLGLVKLTFHLGLGG